MFARLCLLLALLALTARGAAPRATSKFTSTARSAALKHEASDEGFRTLFRGFGDYSLEHLGGDERSWINIRFRGKTVDLYAPTMEAGAGAGAFPHKANDTVEWRGVERGGEFKPHAVIYRIAGLDERGKRQRTRLVVIKLDGARSRIVGFAEGAGEEAAAHRLADRGE